MSRQLPVKSFSTLILVLLSTLAISGCSNFGLVQNTREEELRGPTPDAISQSTETLAACTGQISATRPMTEVFKAEFTHLSGDEANDAFGSAVASGDLDNDGYTDIIIGARGDAVNSDAMGKAYIFKGSATGISTTPSLMLEGEQAKGEFGRTLTAGDINGDGYADVIIGAHGFNGGEGSHQGKVYIYLGGAEGISAAPSQTLLGEIQGSEFGRTFDIVDMNMDGINDLLLGASGFGGDIPNRGKAYVFLGTNTGLNPDPEFTSLGEKENDELARSIAGADVNGDGFTDLVLGAPGGTGRNNARNTVPGTLYVFYGSAQGFAPTYSAKFDGEFPKGHLGEGLSAAGDINHDGFADVAIGARDYACGDDVAGKVYAYLGGSEGLSSDRLWTAIGIGSGGVGRSMAPAGDLDGDGYEDFLSGAPVGSVDSGAGVYVFFGGEEGWGNIPVVLNSNDGDNGIGFSVFSAGDVNGDGAPDIIVGARAGGDSSQGWARVYYGKNGNPTITR